MKTDRAMNRNEGGEKGRGGINRSIITQFTLDAVIIGAIAAIWLVLYGWLAMVLYLIFAAVCITPAILAARRLIRKQNALDNRLLAAEHAIDELDKQINPEEE